MLKENGVRFVQAVGRGEAVAAEPPFQEIESEAGGRGGRLGASDRAALADALAELRACRALLDGLRDAPDGAA